MNLSTIRTFAFSFVGVGITTVAILFACLHRLRNTGPEIAANEPEDGHPVSSVRAHSQSASVPFIVRDTDNDSPGTNYVTRVVTFTAEVGGTPPFALRWQIDHGNGFQDIPGATNSTYRIGNAQVAHSGYYALFATNSAGGIRTTPQQLIVIEGED